MKVIVEKPTQQQLDKLGVTSWSTWECEPSTFDWHYDVQEICYLLQGKVTVKSNSEEVTFEKGDLVTFPAHLSCVWVVHEKVRKHYKLG